MKLIKGLLIALMVVSGLTAKETNHVRVFSMDNADKKVTAKSIQEAFEKEGFMIEANNDMLGPFKRDFKGVVYHDVYNLMVLWDKETFRKLAVKYPKVALFTPLSMSIYTMKGDKTINVSSLSPEGIAQMTGIPAEEPALVALGQKIEKALKKAMPKGKFLDMPYEMAKPEGKLVVEATFKIEGDDWEEAKDDLEMAFEGELAPNGFVSPAFVDLNYDLDEHDIDAYDFFDAYSICKIPVIYTVSQKHPEAGALAPCTMYLYTKKGEKEIHMAFPSVYKWFAALNIQDKESRDVLLDAQKRFENILEKITK
jgi:uncharacterized protein (DUF302 family)